jgi:hypothetical protein
MASTYSSLKIQLMGTGENSGTWGTITNTNLGTAIEEAIVGSANVNFSSADVTLTLTDTNSSQSARNLRLNLTGSVGAPQNLIVPAIEKVYIINNGLTQTITVKNATGNGISVPAGKTEYVYNNGTDVVEAINHLTSLTLDTPLSVASGGTGSNTAAFSGANITNLNVSAVSSGVLPAANGGTGLNAAGTAGNVLTSNGTAWTSVAAAAFDQGTVLIFGQTAAPTGWTKLTNLDNYALRVVSGTAGTGGTVAFTTAFASQTPAGSVSINTSGLSAGATTLSTTQIPSHSHTSQRNQADFGGVPVFAQGEPGATTINTGNTGGGGSHTHTVSGSATGSFTGTAIDLAVQYIDVIRATKN